LSLTKKDLADNISKKLGLPYKDSLFFTNCFFKMLIENRTSNININKFGTFSFKKTPKRIGRNPKTHQEYEIKARKKLSFKSSQEIKNSIN